MKILYIAPQPIPSKAANSIHVMKMMQALGNLGHNATLSFQKPKSIQIDIYNIYGVQRVFDISPARPLPVIFAKAGYVLHNFCLALWKKPDLVFSRNLLSAWLLSFLGQPTIFEIHDSPDVLKPLSQNFFRRFSRKKNTWLIVISQALSDHIQKDHAIPPEKIFLAPDGADAHQNLNLPAPFAKSLNSFHAGYTGHLYKGRGIEIIGEMAAKIPGINFHIVGGNEEDILYWREKLSGLSNVQFHGYVTPAQIPAYLEHFDILLAPYQKRVAVMGNQGDTGRWMSPLKIFEYMAAGKPILCSDLPVLREIMSSENSILCPCDEPESWINAALLLKNFPKDAARLGENALNIFLENYTWLKRAEKILNFVKSNAR